MLVESLQGFAEERGEVFNHGFEEHPLVVAGKLADGDALGEEAGPAEVMRAFAVPLLSGTEQDQAAGVGPEGVAD